MLYGSRDESPPCRASEPWRSSTAPPTSMSATRSAEARSSSTDPLVQDRRAASAALQHAVQLPRHCQVCVVAHALHIYDVAAGATHCRIPVAPTSLRMLVPLAGSGEARQLDRSVRS